MAMNDEYSRACTEALTIINNMSIKNYNKLPKELILSLERNMDTKYDFSIDYSKDINEQNISDITKGILSNIYLDYWADEKNKKQMEKGLIIEGKKESWLKRIIQKLKKLFGR